MLLITHILIAITSLGYTGFTFLNPSKNKFYASYVLVAATLMSGTYLVFLKPAHMVSACMTGIVYLAFVTSGLIAAHRRFVKNENHNQE
ncbi:MAG TPA: hypothetical protein VG965_04555 [Patescibacteria group bacterium]|nr:hypothetical protein [Patescibacteria group bacterium]